MKQKFILSYESLTVLKLVAIMTSLQVNCMHGKLYKELCIH